jgi:hypothetical protein
MSRDDRLPPPDRPFRMPGTGLPTTWLCMGCNTPRPSAGSRGTGVLRRCVHCVAKRQRRHEGAAA